MSIWGSEKAIRGNFLLYRQYKSEDAANTQTRSVRRHVGVDKRYIGPDPWNPKNK